MKDILNNFLESAKSYNALNKKLQENIERVKDELKFEYYKQTYINTKQKFIKYVLKEMPSSPIKRITDDFPVNIAKNQFGDYSKNSIYTTYDGEGCYIEINTDYINIFLEYSMERNGFDEVYMVDVYRIDL